MKKIKCEFLCKCFIFCLNVIKNKYNNKYNKYLRTLEQINSNNIYK